MSNQIEVLNNSLLKGLACAAVSPELRSVLIFDISPLQLVAVANLLRQMLETVEGEIQQIHLGWVGSEDTLWGDYVFDGSSEKLVWQPGLIAKGRSDTNLTLLIIPDLTQLSVSSARACVTLLGADVIHLERHGQHQHWQPNIFWLAGCDRKEVGQVSPHLLDRFALRFSSQAINSSNRVSELRTWIEEPASINKKLPATLSADLITALTKAIGILPEVSSNALSRILDYIQASTNTYARSPRRELALLRLAVACSRLEGDSEVTQQHVDEAVNLIWLELADNLVAVDNSNQTLVSEVSEEEEVEENDETDEDTSSDLSETSTTTVSTEIPRTSTASETGPSTELPIDSENPYPEDDQPIKREAASLQFLPSKIRLDTLPRGLTIGTERTKLLRDIAWVSTILEAAKLQYVRLSNQQTKGRGLLISSTDLRCYRRAPSPEKMLLLIIDYTCLHNCQWQDALTPFLRQAYVERANMCIVQVGWADANDVLQAQAVTAKSILVPRIGAALDYKPGKATPLAHGLYLALRILRSSMQHGRNAVQQTQLVVISDGRGNVPLQASFTSEIPKNVTREGIDDALQIAQKISLLDNVEAILLNPQPRHYSNLPLLLAQALNAEVILVPHLEVRTSL